MTAADEEMVRQLLADAEVGQRLHARVTDEMRAEGDPEEADLEMLRTLLTDASLVERLHLELALPTPTAAECEQRGWSVKAFERCCQDLCVLSCMRRRARDNPGQLDGWASCLEELDTSAEVQVGARTAPPRDTHTRPLADHSPLTLTLTLALTLTLTLTLTRTLQPYALIIRNVLWQRTGCYGCQSGLVGNTYLQAKN